MDYAIYGERLAAICTRESLFAYVLARHAPTTYCQYPRSAA
jgi:hypothetical protein